MNKIDTTATGNVLVEMTPKEWHRAAILFKSNEDTFVNIGEALVRYRRRSGVGLDEIAGKLGVSANYVTLIEWGLARNISPQLQQRISEVIGGQ